MKAIITAFLLFVSLQIFAQERSGQIYSIDSSKGKLDTLYYENANTSKYAVAIGKRAITAFLGMDREQQNNDTFKISKQLSKCSNLRVLSVVVRKPIRIDVDFEKLDSLQEMTLSGYYNEHSINKSVSKNKSLLFCHIYILKNSVLVPKFLSYMPSKTGIVVSYDFEKINFKQLAFELEVCLKASNSKWISFSSNFTLLDRQLTSVQQKCLDAIRKYVNEKKAYVSFFNIEVKATE